MNNDKTIVLKEASSRYSRVDNSDEINIGQWYWIRAEVESYNSDEYPINPPDPLFPWLACIIKIGTNFVEFRSSSIRSERWQRIHFDNFEEMTIYESNYEEIFKENSDFHRLQAQLYLKKIKDISARLGVSETRELSNETAGSALIPVSDNSNYRTYKTALITAKDEQLPELFEKVKRENELLALWIKAETIMLSANIDSMKGILKSVENRIFNVSLYAGLTEQIAHVRKGGTGKYSDHVHLMQRKMFMDEECLLRYEAGGMEFKDIETFDEWLSRSENLSRCLPFPKTIVAFQVRRNEKERERGQTLLEAFIRMQFGEADKLTFLYIRNGENLYRLNCDLNFGSKIFPDRSDFDPQEPMMVSMFADRIDKIIPRREYDELVREDKEKTKKREQWFIDNPQDEYERKNPDSISWDWANPYNHGSCRRLELEYKSFDKSNVYYDEISKQIADQVEQYNRIALIVQGLLDRSEVFHPHPVVKSWIETDFQSVIKLIYDGSMVLYDGDPPEFLYYKEQLNAAANNDSVFVGQEIFWQRREAKKENDRRDRDWRDKSDYRPTYFEPYGNPGPGYIARAKLFHPRSKKATFEWYRERQASYYYNNSPIKTKLTVPLDSLFNISGYHPGDYLQFFEDPRTRANYLKWAPLMLAAEDYHAEKR